MKAMEQTHCSFLGEKIPDGRKFRKKLKLHTHIPTKTLPLA